MMPIGNHPVTSGRFQVLAQPLAHGSIAGAIRSHRVEADEMRIGVIKGVIFLRAGSNAASLASFWQSKDVEVRDGVRRVWALGGVMVPDGRPYDGCPEHFGIDL